VNNETILAKGHELLKNEMLYTGIFFIILGLFPLFHILYYKIKEIL
jgi:hypothetical protein